MAEEQMNILANTILKLNSRLINANDIESMQVLMEEPLREAIHFDWSCFLISGNCNSSVALVTDNSLITSPGKVQIMIIDEDMDASCFLREMNCEIIHSQDESGLGREGNENVLEVIKLKTGSPFLIRMALAEVQGFRMSAYLFRREKPFTSNETETLKQFELILTNCAQSLLMARVSSSKGMLLSGSKDNQDFVYMLLDNNLETAILPESTQKFFVDHFNGPFIGSLPEPLRKWLDSCIKTNSSCDDKRGERSTVIVSDNGNMNCSLYAFEDSLGTPRFLTVFECERKADDFTRLDGIGLSPREIQILANLFAGKSNVQIGRDLDIKEITVRKHLENIGMKLNASGRTEILAKAIEARDYVPDLKHGTSPAERSPFACREPVSFSDPNSYSELIIELNQRLNELRNFEDVPVILKYVLGKQMPFDWAAAYCMTSANEIEKIYVSQGLPFDWVKLYPVIRNLISWIPDVRKGMIGEVFLTQNLINPENIQDLFTKTVMEAATGAYYSLIMPVAKTREYNVFLALYRNNSQSPYTRNDVAIIERLSPVIISWAQSVTRFHESMLSYLGNHIVLEKKNVQAALFDEYLQDIVWTKGAQELLESQIGSSWKKILMPHLRRLFKQNGSEVHEKTNVKKKRTEHLILDRYNLECFAYQLDRHILVKFKPRTSEPFFILKRYGLTEREVQVLSYLWLGCTNRQIALALNICEVTVKKHMAYIGDKFGVFGRVAILRRAEELKRSLSM
jgi:DNA-binding NarL/FixJ family response regulator